MELEEARKILEDICETQGYRNINGKLEIVKPAYVNAIETVLQALDNSISKEKIRNKIEELKRKQIGASTGIYTVQVDVLEELLKK